MLTMALGMSSMLTLAAAAATTTDGAGAYATGKYRDLFAEAGRTPQEIDARIARAWEQLFRGDEQTQRLYFPSGANENGPLAYIPDIQHTDVRSEGMSYGMMIAVQLDKKAEFDALWNWSMTHMYQKGQASECVGNASGGGAADPRSSRSITTTSVSYFLSSCNLAASRNARI